MSLPTKRADLGCQLTLCSFTFNTSLEAQDFPKLAAVVNYGSPEIRWDVSQKEGCKSVDVI